MAIYCKHQSTKQINQKKIFKLFCILIFESSKQYKALVINQPCMPNIWIYYRNFQVMANYLCQLRIQSVAYVVSSNKFCHWNKLFRFMFIAAAAYISNKSLVKLELHFVFLKWQAIITIRPSKLQLTMFWFLFSG